MLDSFVEHLIGHYAFSKMDNVESKHGIQGGKMKNLILSISFFVTAVLIPNLASAVSVTLTDLATGATASPPESAPGVVNFAGDVGAGFTVTSLTVIANQGELVDLLVLTNASITANQPGMLQIAYSDPFESGDVSRRPPGTYAAGYLIFGNFNQSPGDVQYVGTFADQVIEPPFAAAQVNFFLGGPNAVGIPCFFGESEFQFCISEQTGTLTLNFAAPGDTVEIFGSIRQAVSLIPCIGSNCSVGTAIVLDALGPLPVLPVSEPSTLLLTGFGIVVLALLRRSRMLAIKRSDTVGFTA